MDLLQAVSPNFWVAFGSFVFCSVIGVPLSNFVSSNFSAYKQASKEKQQEWDTRFISTIHASTVAVLSTIVLIVDQESYGNPILGQFWGMEAVASINQGYFVADTCLMLFYLTKSYNGYWFDIFHHIANSIVVISCIKNNVLLHLVMVRYLSEWSTPFLNMRWFMLKSKVVEGTIYVANGILLLAFFFLSRIAIMPYMYYNFFAYHDDVKKTGYLQYLILCGVAMDLLNIFWFIKIVQSTLKFMRKPKSS
uniref:Transmembrane protein 56-like n=1 Tax=Phallusia mammillata TaxID=59560 RepID=A0A6F9DVF3_9ASCI|nr:transmembrane protein 56-like [Phallusia mammillata]